MPLAADIFGNALDAADFQYGEYILDQIAKHVKLEMCQWVILIRFEFELHRLIHCLWVALLNCNSVSAMPTEKTINLHYGPLENVKSKTTEAKHMLCWLVGFRPCGWEDVFEN